ASVLRVALERLTPHGDLVAHELIAELERLETVATDRAVAQPYHYAAQYLFQLVLHAVEIVDAVCILAVLADVQQLGGELTGLFRRDARHLGVKRGADRADNAERGRGEIHHVAVTLDERLGVVVDVLGGTRMGDDEGVLVGDGWLYAGRKAVF